MPFDTSTDDCDAPTEPLLCSPEVARKVAAWKERLQDFTRRNPLLSLPEKSVVRLAAPPFTPDELFSRLTGGTKTAENALTFLRETLFLPPPPSLPTGVDTLNEASIAPPLPSLPPHPPLKAGQKLVSEVEHKRLALLRAKANLSLSEQGINILFVTFGSLLWLDPKANTRTRSPLLLVPVSLCFCPAGTALFCVASTTMCASTPRSAAGWPKTIYGSFCPATQTRMPTLEAHRSIWHRCAKRCKKAALQHNGKCWLTTIFWAAFRF